MSKPDLIQERNRRRIVDALAGFRLFVEYHDNGWTEVGPLVFHANRRAAIGKGGGTIRLMRVDVAKSETTS